MDEWIRANVLALADDLVKHYGYERALVIARRRAIAPNYTLVQRANWLGIAHALEAN